MRKKKSFQFASPLPQYFIPYSQVEQPTNMLLNRQLRLLRLCYLLVEGRKISDKKEESEPLSPRSVVSEPPADNPQISGNNYGVYNVEKLLELTECLRLCTSGVSGATFLAENADFLEDVLSKIYTNYVKPLLSLIESLRHKHTTKEAILTDKQQGQIKQW
jgi:hypothetical protein